MYLSSLGQPHPRCQVHHRLQARLCPQQCFRVRREEVVTLFELRAKLPTTQRQLRKGAISLSFYGRMLISLSFYGPMLLRLSPGSNLFDCCLTLGEPLQPFWLLSYVKWVAPRPSRYLWLSYKQRKGDYYLWLSLSPFRGGRETKCASFEYVLKIALQCCTG